MAMLVAIGLLLFALSACTGRSTGRIASGKRSVNFGDVGVTALFEPFMETGAVKRPGARTATRASGSCCRRQGLQRATN